MHFHRNGRREDGKRGSWFARFFPGALLVTAGLAMTGGAARAAVTWTGDFESGDLSQFTWPINATNGTRKNFGTGDLGVKKHIYTGAVTIKAWHQVAFEIHWSKDPRLGNIKVWVDGTPVVDEKAQTKPDDNIMFFQAGIHRANRSPLTDTVFLDNFLEGTTLADVLVSPPRENADGGGLDADASSEASADLVAEPTGGGGGSIAPDGGGAGQSGSGGAAGQGQPGAVTGGCAVVAPADSASSVAAILIVALRAAWIRRRRVRCTEP